MRRRRRLRKILLWSFLFVASVLTGALGFAYTYITDSDTLAEVIREASPKYFPTSQVRVARVQIKPLVGDVELKNTSIWQKIDGKNFETLRVQWLQVRSDFRALLWGKVSTREVVVAHPVLRITKRRDGTLNLQGLLADPWPETALPKPIFSVSNGMIEMVEGTSASPILRDVMLKIEPISDGSYKFEGDARGDIFERMAIAGTFHPKTGRLVLTKGHLSSLAISDTLRNRLPEAQRAQFAKLGLDRGEVNVNIARLVRDPLAATPLDYEIGISLRDGEWNCPLMPFPLSKVAGSGTLTPDTIRIDQAGGYNGKTVIRLGAATISAKDTEHGPLDLKVEAENLDLDDRLRKRTPPKLAELWMHFSPPGRHNLGQVNATVHASRAQGSEEILFKTDVDFLDVAIEYYLFKYPLEHIRGNLHYENKKIALNLTTIVGSEPLTAVGTIDNPGRDAVVAIRFEAGTMPVDVALFTALPPDVRQVVDNFQPKGSVRGYADLKRTPLADDPKGKIEVDAELVLNSGCSIRWKDLPYPVSNLTGRLSLHPNLWEFRDMQGENNLARVAASGRVKQVAKGKFDVDIALKARDLPFDGQLRESLPPAWGERTWKVLNPRGTTDVDARIILGPNRPDDYKLTISPKPDASVSLKLTPAPGTEIASGSGVIELPDMEKIGGTFVFNNGVVQMNHVNFIFRQAPVRFDAGQVVLKDTGAFALKVKDLWINGLRLEYDLRKIMPPVMAEFARKLDDGKTFTARGNMEIGWSGVASDPAKCSWDHARVIFTGNTIAAGLPLEHIQGEIHDIAGSFDGRALQASGNLNLASVKVGGVHFTNVTSPLAILDNKASASGIAAELLGGRIDGQAVVSLATTPEYHASFRLVGAKLEDLARTVSGHQEYKGEVSGNLEISGFGQNLKTITGKGEAHVVNGDMGKLPIYLELLKIVELPRNKPTVFDAADVAFTVENGQAMLNAIKFTSDMISLQGSGTISHLKVLDLSFVPGLGRNDKYRFPSVSAAARKLGGQLLMIHVRGAADAPKITPEVLPALTRNASEVFRKLGDRTERR